MHPSKVPLEGDMGQFPGGGILAYLACWSVRYEIMRKWRKLIYIYIYLIAC